MGLNSEQRRKLVECAIPEDLHHRLEMNSVGEGILQISYLDPDGTHTETHDGKPFIRERLSESERDHRWQQWKAKNKNAKRPGKYSSPSGNGCRIYHSPLQVSKPDYQDRLNSIHTELRITEGEFKTIAANIHDPKCITIGLGGVSSWRDRYDGQSRDEPSRPIVELEEIPMDGRRVRLCFDSDLHKPQVRAALKELAEWLDGRGATVLIEVLPSLPEKDGQGEWVRLGVDDLIHRCGAKAFLEIKSIAQPAFKTTRGNREYKPELEPSNTQRRNVYLKAIAGSNWRALSQPKASWMCWNGTYWEPSIGPDRILSLIEDLMEANGWENRELGTVNSLLAAFRRSVGTGGIHPADGLVPCLNGCLRLADQALLPHDPANGNTYCLSFDFDPLADPRPITDVLQGMVSPTELQIYRACLQSVITGKPRKAFLEITGPGNSGKTVLALLATVLAGEGNSTTSDLEKLENKANRFETIKCRGKSLAVFNECDRYSGALNVLKSLTGRDRITAEVKGGTELVDFYFDGMVLLVGNAPIRPSEGTGAVINRRRSIVVPNVIRSEDQRDLLVRSRDSWRGEFVEHLPGFLNWVLGMSDRDANIALGKDSNDLLRIQQDLETLLDTDPLASWAEEHLVYDPDHPFSRVGNPREQYLNLGTPRNEWAHLLMPHYEERVKFPVGAVKFKGKLVDLLRDTFDLPLPKGSLRRGAYRNREFGSVIPHLRLRTSADKDRPGVITQAVLWRVNPSRDGQPVTQQDSRDGQTPVSERCDGCDGYIEVEIDRETKGNTLNALKGEAAAPPEPVSLVTARVLPVTHPSRPVKPVTDPFTQPVAPSDQLLNGHRQQVLDLIAANPGLIASQYANKIQAAYGIPLNGQQVKALIDEQRQGTA